MSIERLVLSALWIGSTYALCDLKEEDLDVSKIGSVEVTVGWEGRCEEGAMGLAEHTEWLACSKEEGSSDIPPRNYSVIGGSRLRLLGLVPFSRYRFTLGGSRVLFRTAAGISDMKPAFRVLTPGRQSLHLHWIETEDECRHQNGMVEGYTVQLWGLSPWVLNPLTPIRSVLVENNIYEYYFTELLPFTQYGLRVYVRNKGVKGINPGVYLKVKGKTLSTVPSPPSGIDIKTLNHSVLIKWRMEYPPTGEVEYYYSRILETRSGHIKLGRYLHGVHLTCPAEESTDFVCLVLHEDEIISGQNYTVQIRTKNVGVSEFSMYSENVYFFIPPKEINKEISLAPSPKSDENNEEEGALSLATLLLLVILGSAIVILLIVVTALIFKIKKDKLKSPSYCEQHRLTYFPSGSLSARMTDYGNSDSISEIQNRRLPEPPPSIATRKVTETPFDDPPIEYTVIDEDPQYLNVTERQEVDIDGYLTPKFLRAEREDELSTEPADHKSSSNKIQTRSYETFAPDLGEVSRNAGYIDLSNAIRQSNQDILSLAANS